MDSCEICHRAGNARKHSEALQASALSHTHAASFAEAHLRKRRLVLCSTFAGLLEQWFFNVLAPQACSNPRDHANTQRLESAISSGVPGDRLVPN